MFCVAKFTSKEKAEGFCGRFLLEIMRGQGIAKVRAEDKYWDALFWLNAGTPEVWESFKMEAKKAGASVVEERY